MLAARRSKPLRQEIRRGVLPGGLDLCVLPTPGFVAKSAILTVKFGAVDMDFDGADGRPRATPPGIAHFLEHELFKKEGHDALLEFGRWGASANAYTDYACTVYYFRCTERFDECFRLLLDFTLNPFFDDGYIERERKIITQELRMYDDSPDYLAYRNLMPALFRVHPVRIEIGGTVESIGQVTRAHLEELYDGFYRPDNMHLVVAGDVDPARVEAAATEALERAGRKTRRASRRLPDEPAGVVKDRVEAEMASSRGRAIVGYKHVGRSMKPADVLRDRLAASIAMDLVFGRTGDFYAKGYRAGWLDDTFAAAYRREENFGFGLVGGEAAQPEDLADRIRDEARRWAKRAWKRSDVDRLKRKRIGRWLASFDAPGDVAATVSEAVSLGVDPFAVMSSIRRVTPGDVRERAGELFQEGNAAVSIVRPAGGGGA